MGNDGETLAPGIRVMGRIHGLLMDGEFPISGWGFGEVSLRLFVSGNRWGIYHQWVGIRGSILETLCEWELGLYIDQMSA